MGCYLWLRRNRRGTSYPPNNARSGVMGNRLILSVGFWTQQIAGRWLFGRVVCNIFNANDVLFSTASLLHLCCISLDRYLAVTDPFKYQRKMSPRRAAAMLTVAWSASVLLSHAPIHLGWYAVNDDITHTGNYTQMADWVVSRKKFVHCG